MADRGHPIVGDGKYGKSKDGFRRLALHAKSLSFNHPFTGKRMTFDARVPNYFSELVERV
jgi:tRNA pseudouridine32 synthase/23S rRNA pseudouridine746 synthase/23S rRNA pseudouridine1911/1915/1917 synthase